MPAAAVIPAPIAYIKVVAVKKLVVVFRGIECKKFFSQTLSAERRARGFSVPFVLVTFSVDLF